MSRKGRRWRGLALALLLVLVAGQGISSLVRTRWLHARLTQQLSATFGRPVEVSRFTFSLAGRPRLEADYVTVGEDPRFGYEHFLRAERLTASLRWRSLLRGRFEFGTLRLARPSLNLVRNAAGHWNIESWLPPTRAVAFAAPRPETALAGEGPPAPSSGGGRRAEVTARLYRIEIDTGRVNLKFGVDKHPFALADVTGNLEQETTGRWRMDLEARVVRAGVVVQQAGSIRVRGRVGGTSARLQPADLRFTWDDAELSDALRLARGQDYGIWGRVSLDVTARSLVPPVPSAVEGPVPIPQARDEGIPLKRDEGEATPEQTTRWSFRGAARMRGLHRWDSPPRPSDPSLNLLAEADWWPAQGRLDLKKGEVEAPRSSIRATGSFIWPRSGTGFQPVASHTPTADSDIRLASSGIDLGDLLVWVRAFRPGIAAAVEVEGSAGLDLELKGWPPRIEHGSLALPGAYLRAPGAPERLGIGRVVFLASGGESGRVELRPVTLTVTRNGIRRGELRVTGTASPVQLPKLRENGSSGERRPWNFQLNVAGQTDYVEDLHAAASSLSWDFARGWTSQGAARFDVTWKGTFEPGPLVVSGAEPQAEGRRILDVQRSGTIELRTALLHPPLLNQPLRFTDTRVELASPPHLLPGAADLRIRGLAAQAFGARWHGWLRRRASDRTWEFAVTADRLDAAGLDRWLNPRWRAPTKGLLERLVPGAVERMLPGQPDTSVAEGDTREALIGALRAQGRLTMGQFVLSPAVSGAEPPVVLRRFQAQVDLNGRTLHLPEAQAEFYGGAVHGWLRAELRAEPVYRLQARLEGVNLGNLAAAAPALAGRFAGTASGQLTLVTRGAGRESLIGALEGRGTAEARDAQFRGLDLVASLRAGSTRLGLSKFQTASAEFTLGARKIQFEKLRLFPGGSAELELTGSVDFARALDLRVQSLVGASARGGRVRPAERLRLTGSLASPQVSR